MTDKQPDALEVAATLENTPANAAHWERGGLMERAAMTIRRLHAANLDCVAHFDALIADHKALTAAARLALEALKNAESGLAVGYGLTRLRVGEAITALQAALKGQA